MPRGGTARSGRPDLNRGPPAPKAGAIPGYATPRSERKLLYAAFSAQRAQQRAKCARAMAQRGFVLHGQFSVGSAELGHFEVGVVAKTSRSSGAEDNAPPDLSAPDPFSGRILERSDADV